MLLILTSLLPFEELKAIGGRSTLQNWLTVWRYFAYISTGIFGMTPVARVDNSEIRKVRSGKEGMG